MFQSPDHAAYLSRQDFVTPPGDSFTTDERELLRKFGRWLEALANGTITPNTPAQEQFVKVVRSGSEPTTDFERAWIKVLQTWATRDEVVRTFQGLAEARARRAQLEAEYSAARAAVLAQVREQLDAVDERFAAKLAETEAAAVEGEQELRELVLRVRHSVTLAGIRATYVAKRITWDTPGLDQYAQLHPEVNMFRKIGKPTVALRFLDQPSAAKPVTSATQHSAESDHTEEAAE